MSDNVQFETDMQGSAMRRPEQTAAFGQSVSSGKGMAGWLMRHGFAKTPAAAQGIMVGVILVDIVAIFIVIKYFL